jgi:hypothetical protein
VIVTNLTEEGSFQVKDTISTLEMLGEGTAETELKAGSDAFCAGMTYIERLKRRSGPTDTSLH